MVRVRVTNALRCVVGFAAKSGVPPPELFRAAALDPALLAAPDADLLHSEELGLWDQAARLTGDRDFGLHLAEWLVGFPKEHFDVLAFAARSCATLGDNYRRVARYIRLIHDGIYLALDDDDEPGLVRLVHGHYQEPREPPRHPVEGQLALALLQGRRAIGEEFSPRAVRFRHARPDRVSEHERIFRAPVHYDCPRNELVLDRTVLERPQRHADARLLAMVERQLESLLSDLPDNHRFLAVVERTIMEALPDGEPEIAAIAGKLHMSPRSLQRRLRSEGTSFAESLSALRHDHALRYLRDQRISIGEVGFLLGFLEMSSFYRAFKRWTGSTPAAYRRRALASRS